jgi:hypothetical protein
VSAYKGRGKSSGKRSVEHAPYSVTGKRFLGLIQLAKRSGTSAMRETDNSGKKYAILNGKMGASLLSLFGIGTD